MTEESLREQVTYWTNTGTAYAKHAQSDKRTLTERAARCVEALRCFTLAAEYERQLALEVERAESMRARRAVEQLQAATEEDS